MTTIAGFARDELGFTLLNTECDPQECFDWLEAHAESVKNLGGERVIEPVLCTPPTEWRLQASGGTPTNTPDAMAIKWALLTQSTNEKGGRMAVVKGTLSSITKIVLPASAVSKVPHAQTPILYARGVWASGVEYDATPFIWQDRSCSWNTWNPEVDVVSITWMVDESVYLVTIDDAAFRYGDAVRLVEWVH